MKVYIRDKRANPRVIYIDGKRFVFPSNKEIMRDISKTAFNNLLALDFIEVREVADSTDINAAKETTKSVENVKKEEQKPADTPKKKEPEVDVSGLVVDEKLEDSTIVSSAEETKQEEAPKVEESIVENKEEVKVEGSTTQEEPKAEEQEAQQSSTDYSSLTKKELKALVEEKGGDPTGMTKANLLDWLKVNA